MTLKDTNRIIIVGKTKSGGQKSAILSTEGIASCLSATDYKQPKQICISQAKPKVIKVGGLYGMNHQAGGIYNPNGLSPTLDTMQGGNRMPLIITEDKRNAKDKSRK